MGGAFHQIGLVIKFFNPYSFGKTFIYFGNFLFNIFNDLPAVAPAEHHNYTGDDFSFAILRYRSLPNLPPDFHRGHIANKHGFAFNVGDNNFVNILNIANLPESPDDVLFPVVFQIVPPGNAVIGRNGIHNFL